MSRSASKPASSLISFMTRSPLAVSPMSAIVGASSRPAQTWTKRRRTCHGHRSCPLGCAPEDDHADGDQTLPAEPTARWIRASPAAMRAGLPREHLNLAVLISPIAIRRRKSPENGSSIVRELTSPIPHARNLQVRSRVERWRSPPRRMLRERSDAVHQPRCGWPAELQPFECQDRRAAAWLGSVSAGQHVRSRGGQRRRNTAAQSAHPADLRR